MNARAQVNLVQNGSFEEYNQCPDENDCDIANLPHWQWSRSAHGYLNLCNFSDTIPAGCAAPFSVTDYGCFQYPQHGDAYVNIENKIYPVFDNRNQIQTRLLHPLDSGQCYYFSMYINLCDSCLVAIDDIGVLFRKNYIYINTGPFNPIYTFPPPQIIHKGTFITEKLEWVKYEGTFKADGDEEYMLIGSFSYPDSINMIVLDNGHQFSNKASYLVDNITLIECDSIIGVKEQIIPEINIYPNPTQDYFVVDAGKLNNVTIELFDISGRKLWQKLTTNQDPVDVSGLASGVYIAVVSRDGQVVKRERIIINR